MIRRFLPLLIVLGVGCGVPPADPADLILVGGTVWTGSMDSGSVQAVAVRDGRVQAVGTDREIRALRGPESEVVELEGRMLLPGFIDSHTHFIPGGFQLSSVDLRDAATPQEFARRIGEFARTVEPGSWITGGDWDHEMWGE